MTRLPANVSRIKFLIFAFALFVFASEVNAQADCRSAMGAYLKPVSDNIPLHWAAELTLSPGIMSDRQIFNGMAYLGLGYFSKSNLHQFYFEGAYKYWYSSTDGPGLSGTGTGYSDFNKPEKKHLGFREMYYEYKNGINLKAGIQSMKSTGSMLLDERVLGINASKEWSNWTVRVASATVYDDIARMQDVCGTRHLYNLVRGSKVNFVGDKMLDSNFWLVELGWKAGKKTNADSGSRDEFASFETENEFSEFATETKPEKPDFLQFSNVSFRLYEEFGIVFPAYKYYAGTNASLKLGKLAELQTELLGQWMDENKAVFWKASLHKNIFSSKGAVSSLKIGYLGMIKMDSDIQYFPSYSNLFKGEVMRLDVMHLPLFDFGFTHRFASTIKSQIECNYIHQLEGANTRELNVLYSLKPWKHLHLYAIAAWMQSDLMEKDNYLMKLEARFAF